MFLVQLAGKQKSQANKNGLWWGRVCQIRRKVINEGVLVKEAVPEPPEPKQRRLVEVPVMGDGLDTQQAKRMIAASRDKLRELYQQEQQVHEPAAAPQGPCRNAKEGPVLPTVGRYVTVQYLPYHLVKLRGCCVLRLRHTQMPQTRERSGFQEHVETFITKTRAHPIDPKNCSDI
ncbi:hypothetical protein PSTG_15322 [Puccinia striiformis f. sp. tritici PST-78]|uniref:Uncharacterized protein n=1 Tax=Puccinia striiformis f. sp. tritici PST-78 TaxID=1165861 RepID=A0A0L0UW30_9BASI|nr:hypothetical protein PSTG_15322 [Puccinia striiformis f. sp. tritici PST-78]